MILIVGNRMPTPSGAVRVRNYIRVRNDSPVCNSLLHESPMAIYLSNVTSTIQFNPYRNQIGMPTLCPGNKRPVPVTSRVISIPGNGNQLNNALIGVPADSKVSATSIAGLHRPTVYHVVPLLGNHVRSMHNGTERIYMSADTPSVRITSSSKRPPAVIKNALRYIRNNFII